MIKIIPKQSDESQKPLKNPFPKIMIHKENPNRIYLFLSSHKSIILKCPDIETPFVIDEYSSSEYFKDFLEPITIQNVIPGKD